MCASDNQYIKMYCVKLLCLNYIGASDSCHKQLKCQTVFVLQAVHNLFANLLNMPYGAIKNVQFSIF